MLRSVKYIGILGFSLAASAAAAGVVWSRRHGDAAWVASVLPAVAIWVLGAISLALVARAQTSAGRVNAALFGILLRMSLPLAGIAYFSNSRTALAAAGITSLIVIHYLVGLVVETLCCVRLIQTGDQRSGKMAPSAVAPPVIR